MKRKNKRFSSVFDGEKYEKPTEMNIMRLLAPSFIGMIVCMFCLAEMTWAWFSYSNSTPWSKLTSAEFSVSTVVTIDGEKTNIQPIGKNLWSLEKGNYNVEIYAVGTAKTGGYCEVTIGNTSYHTMQMYSSIEKNNTSSVSFKVSVTGSEPLIFSVQPYWGNSEHGTYLLISPNSIITDKNTTQVVDTDKLNIPPKDYQTPLSKPEETVSDVKPTEPDNLSSPHKDENIGTTIVSNNNSKPSDKNSSDTTVIPSEEEKSQPEESQPKKLEMSKSESLSSAVVDTSKVEDKENSDSLSSSPNKTNLNSIVPDQNTVSSSKTEESVSDSSKSESVKSNVETSTDSTSKKPDTKI